MMNKKLVFCSFLTLFQIIGGVNANAVDVIRAEDEDLLWEANVHSGETLKGAMTDLTEGEYDGYGRKIVRVQRKEPAIGVPVQQIKVPDEVNAQAPLYANPEIMSTYYDAPQNVVYPTATARRDTRESSKDSFDMDLMMQGYSAKSIGSHRARIDSYRTEINNCIGSRRDRLGLEMSMLDSPDNLYENTAYLTQTLEAIEQCYDNIGLDIIDEFYGHDNAVLRDYNQRSAGFHVNGDDVQFNPKYCRENCSVKALAELQLEKFDEFRIYLYKLLDKAPIIPPVVAREEPVAPVVNEYPARAYQRNVAYQQPRQQQMRAAPKALRVRTPEGEIKYVRLKSDGEYELMDNNPQEQPVRRAQSQKEFRPLGGSGNVEVAPMRYDYDGVPLIDEADL